MLIDSWFFERIYFDLRFCTSTEYSFDMFINGNGALFFHTSTSLPLLQDTDVSLFDGNIILSYVMFRVLGIRSRRVFQFLGCNIFGNDSPSRACLHFVMVRACPLYYSITTWSNIHIMHNCRFMNAMWTHFNLIPRVKIYC